MDRLQVPALEVGFDLRSRRRAREDERRGGGEVSPTTGGDLPWTAPWAAFLVWSWTQSAVKNDCAFYDHGVPKVSDEHRAARREQILGAAAGCVARQGFHRMTMADVISAAG